MTSLLRHRLSLRGLDPPSAAFFLSMLASPFYVFASGLPQPGDFLKVLAAGMLLASHRFQVVIPQPLKPFAFTILLFVGWVHIVSLSWYLLLDDLSVLVPIFHQSFNLLLFVTTLSLLPRHGREVFGYFAVFSAASLFLVMSSAIVLYDPSLYRQTLTFNNPNQLGYYAILAVSIFFCSSTRVTLPRWLGGAVIGMAVIIIFLSASRAAALSLLPLSLLAVRDRRRTVLALAALAVGLGLYLVGPTPSPDTPAPALETDMLTREGGTERGYDRIFNHPEYLLVGAGESAYYRFQTALLHIEIHSTFGTVWFSYGTVGLGLFVTGIARLLRRPLSHQLVWLAPPMIYGLTHNGLRFTEFWVFLAVAGLQTASASDTDSIGVRQRSSPHPAGAALPTRADIPPS